VLGQGVTNFLTRSWNWVGRLYWFFMIWFANFHNNFMGLVLPLFDALSINIILFWRHIHWRKLENLPRHILIFIDFIITLIWFTFFLERMPKCGRFFLIQLKWANLRSHVKGHMSNDWTFLLILYWNQFLLAWLCIGAFNKLCV